MDATSPEFKKNVENRVQTAMQNLIKVVSHDKNKQFASFNINVDNEHFPFQRLPFYQAPTIGFYEIAMSVYTFRLMQLPFGIQDILYQSKVELFRLTASHPKYCETHYKYTQNENFLEITNSLYHSKGGSIIAKTYSKIINLSAKSKQRIVSRRENKKQNWKQLYVEPDDDEFIFAAPHTVGAYNKKLVFLGDLKVDGGDNKIYCDGLNTFNKFLENHPYFGGRGDHINHCGVYDILCQLSNLIVRNAYKFNYVKHKIMNHNDKFDDNCIVTVGFCDINYRKRLELNTVYKVKIDDLKFMNDMKYSFVIEVNARIIQHDIDATHAKFKIYPVFRRSYL